MLVRLARVDQDLRSVRPRLRWELAGIEPGRPGARSRSGSSAGWQRVLNAHSTSFMSVGSTSSSTAMTQLV